MKNTLFPFWQCSASDLMHQLGTSWEGLEEGEAASRLQTVDSLSLRTEHPLLLLFFRQFKSPLTLLLIGAALFSFTLHNSTDAFLILLIVLGSGSLSFFQEKGACRATEKLLARVQINTAVIRGGKTREIPITDVVPGDIVFLRAGDKVPGDCLVLESKDCFVDEAMLTGETFHREKKEGVLPVDTPLAQRCNSLFMGSHVVSGQAKALVVLSGQQTEFGKVAERLRSRLPKTSFTQGLRHFGYLLVEITCILVLAIFALNIYLARPVLESFLFATALAVGLTPQLLPAIVTINLARGAKKMAKEKMIVKRLVAIENLGSMNILCADKTGTLTHGVIQFDGWVDWAGNPAEQVAELAYLNAVMQTGYPNPLDEAIALQKRDISRWQKRDEIPYDFVRKRVSIAASNGKETLLITKGAFSHIAPLCSQARTAQGEEVPFASVQQAVEERFAGYCAQGFRALAIATRTCSSSTVCREKEKEMTFLGFLLFFDQLKPGIIQTIDRLKKMGITLKIITGDHHLVTDHIAQQIGLEHAEILLGNQLDMMGEDALVKKVQHVDLFAEVDPHQKERIILALRKAGYTIGFLGDGINDATALHAADVGISVNTAADVAQEVADIVMLQKDLSALCKGIREGRKTFANTLKYILMASSANFGNMFSMAGISAFLPFLPLLPKQILLMNLLTDMPEMGIATDHVDHETLEHPVQWDLQGIKKFMLLFGCISSLFDVTTFAILLYTLHASPVQLRTGWFIESVVSAAAIVLVIRTPHPFFRSRPSSVLAMAVYGVIFSAALLPFTPWGNLFGFVPLPARFYWAIGAIVALYILSVEIAKRYFYRYCFSSLSFKKN